MSDNNASGWLNYVQNPLAITSLYDAPPDLHHVWLHRMEFEDSWPCTVVLATSQLPSRPPKRWKEFNIVHVRLGMVEIRNVEVHGWPWERFVLATVTESPSGMVFNASGEGIGVHVVCSGISVCSVKGSLVEEKWLKEFSSPSAK